jgi:LSD1 subclass zinc finger protein
LHPLIRNIWSEVFYINSFCCFSILWSSEIRWIYHLSHRTFSTDFAIAVPFWYETFGSCRWDSDTEQFSCLRAQSQLVCSGSWNLLLYSAGAPSVRFPVPWHCASLLYVHDSNSYCFVLWLICAIQFRSFSREEDFASFSSTMYKHIAAIIL